MSAFVVSTTIICFLLPSKPVAGAAELELMKGMDTLVFEDKVSTTAKQMYNCRLGCTLSDRIVEHARRSLIKPCLLAGCSLRS